MSIITSAVLATAALTHTEWDVTRQVNLNDIEVVLLTDRYGDVTDRWIIPTLPLTEDQIADMYCPHDMEGATLPSVTPIYPPAPEPQPEPVPEPSEALIVAAALAVGVAASRQIPMSERHPMDTVYGVICPMCESRNLREYAGDYGLGTGEVWFSEGYKCLDCGAMFDQDDALFDSEDAG